MGLLNLETPLSVQRHKSEFFEADPHATYMTDRLKAKENLNGMNPVRAKLISKLNEGPKLRSFYSNEYYGLISDR